MRQSFIGKRGRDRSSRFANVEVHLLEPRLESKHHAVTNVDPIGVIEHFTFADVAHEVGRWAHLLRSNGLQPGDRVLVLAGREWAWRCALLGVLRAGGVAVPCPASLPVEEIRAIAASAGAGHLISIPARPDLAEDGGLAVLDADGIDAIDASRALGEPAHESLRADVALVLYERRPDGLRGAMHTHASLIAQADAGRHWLGVAENEPVWCTAADGSPESIWLVLAGWHEGANIVNVDLELDSEDLLELLGRLGTAAVWFSDEEYVRLESAAQAAWINGSINRVLFSDERSKGATAFADAVGASVAAVFGLAELGVVAGWPAGAEGEDTTVTARPVPDIELAVVDEQGTRLPAGLVGDIVVRSDAPSLITGYSGGAQGVPKRGEWFRLGWRGALAADGVLRLASRSPAELDPIEAEAEAEERRRREDEEARKLAAAAATVAAAEAESARREAAAAEERRRVKERRREEERRRADQEAKRRAAQEAREREQAEAAARAEREAEERRRTEEQQRHEEERRRQEEEARRRSEQQARERAQAEAAAWAEREAAAAEERRRADEAERVRREAAAAEERRRAEKEQRRQEERRREDARRRAEQETRRLAEASAAVEALRAKRTRREAADGEERPQKEDVRLREAQQARERAQAVVAAWAERETAAAEERRRAEEADRARGESAAAEKRHRAQKEVGRRQEAATARTRANRNAARTTNQRRAKEARQPKRAPRVWPWQLLSLILLLVSGALLGAYFHTRPDHDAALSAKVQQVTKRKSTSATGAVSGQARAPARKGDRSAVVRRPVSETASSQRQYGSSTVGLPMAVAWRELEAAGFSVHLKYVYSQVPSGQVVTQKPPGKIPVKSGRKVVLVISVGPHAGPPRARRAGTSSQ